MDSLGGNNCIDLCCSQICVSEHTAHRFYRYTRRECDERCKGVASFIVETMTALAGDRYDASEVQLSCFNGNTAGLLLYPKLGFQPFAIEERASPEGDRLALIHMTRRRAG